MEERRRHKRFSLGAMELSSRMLLASYVKILDISIGGVSFKADRRLNVGMEYSLRIRGKDKELTVKGVIVRASLSESMKDSRGNVIPVYNAGMQFTDVSEEKLKEIEEFIKTNIKETDKPADLRSPSGRRLYVRVYLDRHKESTLNFHETFNIKNISLGGMLIESDCCLKTDDRLPLEIFISEDKSIKAIGRIVTSEPVKEGTTGQYNTRIEFVEMSAGDRQTLKAFLNELAS